MHSKALLQRHSSIDLFKAVGDTEYSPKFFHRIHYAAPLYAEFTSTPLLDRPSKVFP